MQEMNAVFSYLNDLNDEAREAQFNFHGLMGFSYCFSQLLRPTSNAKTIYLRQWQRNLTALKELDRLYEGLDRPVVLKGAGLLKSLYADNLGARFMSDIDLLVAPERFEYVGKQLIDQGFEKLQLNKWYGDNFKQEYVKDVDGSQVVIELHHQLFYTAPNIEYKTQDSFYKMLEVNAQWVHLIGHYSMQHTMQKLYWLMDIVLYYEKYKQEIDFNYCESLAKAWGVFRGYSYTMVVLKRYFALDVLVSQIKGEGLIDVNFLVQDDRRTFKYLILKQLMKDNIQTILRYNLNWLKR